eukprot:g1744.t1
MIKLEEIDVSKFWQILPHFLSTLCLSKGNSSDEIRLLSLSCIHELLVRSKICSTELCQELMLDLELKKCLALLICDRRITKAAFGVLASLFERFDKPVIWYGILPSTVSELSAYLAQIGGWVENKDAVLPLSASTIEAIEILTKLITLVFSDNQLQLLHPSLDNSPKQLQSLHSIIKGDKLSDAGGSGLKTEAEEGSPEWFEFSIQKIVPLLSKRLPPLVNHPSPNVRAAFAKAISLILKECSKSLHQLSKELIGLLLVLSMDDYPKVSEACLATQTGIKERFRIEGKNCQLFSCFENIIRDGIDSLSLDFAVSENKGISKTKMLSSAIDLLSGSVFNSWLIEDPPFFQSLYHCLVTEFEFDDRMVKTVIQGSKPGLLTAPVEDSSHSFCLNMPLALLHLTNQESYANFARLVETVIGSLSINGFYMIVDLCLDDLRAKKEKNDEHWELSVASVIVLMSHTIHGCSLNDSRTQNNEVKSRNCRLLEIIIRLLETVEEFKLWTLEAHSLRSYKNAILLITLLDLVSVIGSMLTTNLRTSACKVMRLVLMHLLERLADPCEFVQSSAQMTINMLCVSVGVSSLSELIIEFGDYVVDGVCSQLSNLKAFPMAPYLLSALFSHAHDLPKTVLPLLAEPASHAFQGLSIMGRASTPHYSIPFLKSLKVMAECGRVAAEEGNMKLANILDTKTLDKSELTVQELNETQQQMQILHSSATLADGIANLACPLFSYSDPQTSLLSFEACMKSLHALQSATAASDVYKSLISAHLPSSHVESTKVPPELPSLHKMIGPIWRSLMEALKSPEIPIIERALEFLGEIAVLFEGRTLSRRFKDESWPLMRKLLIQGNCIQSPMKLIPHGSHFLALTRKDSDLEDSFTSRQRCQRAVLCCLETIGKNKSSRFCLKSVLKDIIKLVVPLLLNVDSCEMQDVVSNALVGLALVDADLIWWKLKELQSTQSKKHEVLEALFVLVEKAEVTWHDKVLQLIGLCL